MSNTRIVILAIIWTLLCGGAFEAGRSSAVHVHDVTDSIVYNPDDNSLSFNGVTLACQKPDQWRIK